MYRRSPSDDDGEAIRRITKLQLQRVSDGPYFRRTPEQMFPVDLLGDRTGRSGNKRWFSIPVVLETQSTCAGYEQAKLLARKPFFGNKRTSQVNKCRRRYRNKQKGQAKVKQKKGKRYRTALCSFSGWMRSLMSSGL